MTINSLSRRKLLAALGLGTGTLVLGHQGSGGDVVLSPRQAWAEDGDISDQPLIAFLYFGGGWDTLLSLDPRDDTVYGDGDKAIHTALDLVRINDPAVEAVLQNNPSGIVQPPTSNIDFGPAVGNLSNYFNDLCVVRGIDMGTLTHEVGRRYFITGKFPRGVLPSGSGLPTWIASQDPSLGAIPNLVVGGMETFNEGLDPKATGLSINSYADLGKVLRPLNEMLQSPAAMEQAVAKHLTDDHCFHRQMDVGGMVEAYRAGWQKAREIGGGSLWEHFDFVASPTPGSEIDVVYSGFDINKNNPFNDLSGPKGKAAVAAQALTNDLCQAVSVRLTGSLDTHFENWGTSHSFLLRQAFDAVANFIQFLKDKKDKNGKSYWERTTLVLMSEFSRTPALNAQDGRDHHLCNSCVLAGNGIKGNQVIGASTQDGYQFTSFDFEAQQALAINDGATAIRPADVHATVCEAMGVDYEHISNQEPRLLTKALV